MGKKKTAAAQDAEDTPSFEHSMAELQQIVASLEDGSLGLEESMRQFESGMLLLRSCYGILSQAEQRIEILTRLDDNGEPVTKPFDATATIDRAPRAGIRRARSSRSDSNADSDADDDEQPPGPTLF